MGACLVKPETNSAVAPYISPVKKLCPKLRLYGDECCPFTSRIRIALEFKGIPVEVLWLNSEDDKETSKQLSMTFMMPDGKLPMLQNQGQLISGSADEILDYIEAQFPKPSLLGGSSAQKVREWVRYVRDIFSPALIKALYSGDSSTQQECAMQLNEAYNKFDSAIAKYSSKGPYFFGNQFCFVDVYLVPFLLLTRPLSYFRGIDISPVHKHLVSYCTRMSSFASYAPIRMDLEILQTSVARALTRSGPPPLVAITMLQHQSILGHFGKLVCTADELALTTKQPAKIVDPVKGSISMQIRKLITRYGYLLDFMLEHAQMEECVIFPALEKADRGITKSANQSHANDLPVMNGIKEDLKAVLALDQHTPSRAEALQNVAARLRALQVHIIEHFREEEVDLLPLLNAAGLGIKQQASLLGQCTGIMDSMHKRLFPFLLSGLRPHQIHQYLSSLQRCAEGDDGRMMDTCLRGMICTLKQSDDEYEFIWSLVKARFPALASLGDAVRCTV